MAIEDLPDKIRARLTVDATGGCWIWTGHKNNMGYGMVAKIPGHRSQLVHRISWEVANGAILNDLCCLHACDRPLCCNPEHLFLGTRHDNMIDMARKRRGKKSLVGLPYGVDRVREGGYQVLLTVANGRCYFGYFHSIDEAGVRADEVRRTLYGE